jgi:hypothetical protein
VALDGVELWKIYPDFLGNRIPGTNKYWAHINMEPGAHKIESRTKFSGYIYGFSQYNSYGWPAAMVLNDLTDTVDTEPPEYTSAFDCGIYTVHATELKNGPADWIPYQEDTGISDIRLLPESYNIVLEYITSPDIPKDPPSFEFDFQLRVLDRYKKASGVFIIEDNAGNYLIDSIVYNFDLPNLQITMQKYTASDKITPGTVVPIKIYADCDDWNTYPATNFQFELIYNTKSMIYDGRTDAGEILGSGWTISASDELLDGENSILFITGNGNTAISGNGVLAEPHFLILLSDSAECKPYFGGIKFGLRDSCLLYSSKQGSLYSNTCARNLRPIKTFGQDYFINAFYDKAGDRLNISYGIGLEANTRLELFDSFGMLVETVISDNLKPGKYRTETTPGSLTSGIYFLRISTGPYVTVAPVAVVR